MSAGALHLLEQLKIRFGTRSDGDEELVRYARRGDRRAFDELVRRHEPRLRGFIGRRVGAQSLDDVVQETLVSAWSNLSRFQSRSTFKAWLYGIAIHKCDDYYRKRLRQQAEIPLQDGLSGWHSPEALYAAAELRETVRQILVGLPPPQREVLELYYYAELTLAEIASVLNRNPNTVKYQFYRAHARVEESLRRDGTLSPDALLSTDVDIVL